MNKYDLFSDLDVLNGMMDDEEVIVMDGSYRVLEFIEDGDQVLGITTEREILYSDLDEVNKCKVYKQI